jgi:hypothetical protein
VRAALDEALLTYSSAEQMAQQQVQRELADLWAAELSAAPADLQRACSMPASLAAFWSEQGLPRVQAERLARELIGGHSPCCSLDILAAKLARLHRVLPVDDLGAGGGAGWADAASGWGYDRMPPARAGAQARPQNGPLPTRPCPQPAPDPAPAPPQWCPRTRAFWS